MTVDTPFKADESLFDQAAGWFFRLRADDVTALERQAFARWHAQSADHWVAWEEAQGLYVALEEPARTLFHQGQASRKASPRRGAGRWSWAGGLCCAGLMMGVVFLKGPGALDRWQADYATEVGQRQSLELADGSRVELNSDTALTVRYGEDGRVIRLLRGEAYFEVAADKARPFRVLTEQGSVTAVGTAFAVRQGAEDTGLVVSEGVVSVQGNDAGGSAVAVSQGQGLHFTEDRLDLPQVSPVGAVLAWREGKAVFRQRPLGHVIGELDRYWPGLTLVVDQDLAAEPVSGVIDLDRREASLNALAVLLGAEVTTVTPYFAVIHRP